MYRTFRTTTLLLAAALALAAGPAAGCGSDEGNGDDVLIGYEPGDDNGVNNGYGGGGSQNNATNNAGGYVPETEEAFEFSRPAVVGDDIYIANETLNAVAIVDSGSLRIRTVAVGSRPTRVVGPTASAEAPTVMALNEGSSSVTFIDTDDLDTTTVPVLRHANWIEADPGGTQAVAWFDPDRAEPGEAAGDLSAVSLVRIGEDGKAESHQIAVGYRVRRVSFTSDGSRALVLTDDGISVLDLAKIDGDTLVPPVTVMPGALSEVDPEDLEVLLGPDGRWAIARSAAFAGVVLLDIDADTRHVVPLDEIPTDLDWIEGTPARVLIMLPQHGEAVLASVPGGLIEAAEAALPAPAGDFAADAGSDAGNDAGADAGYDAGNDAGADAGYDAGDDAGAQTPDEIEGFAYIDVLFDGLGAAEIARDGETALLFTTLGDQRAALLDLGGLEQRGLRFEKGLRGAASDARGTSFVAFHTREEGQIPADATPGDEVFVARSWGLSVIDVPTATSRLVLTKQKPGPFTLWTAEGEDPQLYVTFEPPTPLPANPGAVDSSYREVLAINLTTFATETFLLASLPEGLGPIPGARRIYVSQHHPQGRLTFIDVDGDHQLRTVTGYQLNAGID